jgi:hypothetical protein
VAKPVPSRAQRFEQLRREAARELGIKATDEKAAHVATLRLARETVATRLIAGQAVDPDALLKLDEALKHYLPAEELRVEVEIVSGHVDICPRCHWTRPAEPRPLTEAERLSRTIDATAEVVPDDKQPEQVKAFRPIRHCSVI